MRLPERKWIAERVGKVREAHRRQGHSLERLQQGIVEAVAAWDPAHEPASRKELDAIRSTIREKGRWSGQEEWRILTWLESSIARSSRNGAELFEVAVECDGQRLTCGSPTLEGAYAYVRLYQALIVDQFYPIGPPWANTGIFQA